LFHPQGSVCTFWCKWIGGCDITPPPSICMVWLILLCKQISGCGDCSTPICSPGLVYSLAQMDWWMWRPQICSSGLVYSLTIGRTREMVKLCNKDSRGREMGFTSAMAIKRSSRPVADLLWKAGHSHSQILSAEWRLCSCAACKHIFGPKFFKRTPKTSVVLIATSYSRTSRPSYSRKSRRPNTPPYSRTSCRRAVENHAIV